MGLTWNGAEARERLCCGGEGLGFQGRRGKGIRGAGGEEEDHEAMRRGCLAGRFTWFALSPSGVRLGLRINIGFGEGV